MKRRKSDGVWWRRWVESRWLMVTMLTLGGGFYLAVRFEDPGVFSTIAVVALGAGQMHNTFSRPRPPIRSETSSRSVEIAGGGQADMTADERV